MAEDEQVAEELDREQEPAWPTSGRSPRTPDQRPVWSAP